MVGSSRVANIVIAWRGMGQVNLVLHHEASPSSKAASRTFHETGSRISSECLQVCGQGIMRVVYGDNMHLLHLWRPSHMIVCMGRAPPPTPP